MREKVDKPRNCGTMSEAAYWGAVRSGLRRTFRYWKPAKEVKFNNRKPYVGTSNLRKWTYTCEKCKGEFKEKDTEIDHIIPVGSLKSSEDLVGFLERLTPEEGYRLLCKKCHSGITNTTRNARKNHPREAQSYYNMLERCINKKATGYEKYGGRGIEVCNRWQLDFSYFYEDMGDRPEDTSIDRIDNNGNYEPDNCKWSTQKEQCNNTRHNNKIEWSGVNNTLTEWAEYLNIKPNTILTRLRRGWSVEESCGLIDREENK